MAEEQVFLSERGVVVSNSRFSCGGQTYAMANVTSVRAARAGMGVGVAFVLFGVLCCLGGGAGIAFGAVLIVIGALLIITRSAYVVLHTAGGEQRALSSRNVEFVTKVVSAVNEAIVHRG